MSIKGNSNIVSCIYRSVQHLVWFQLIWENHFLLSLFFIVNLFLEYIFSSFFQFRKKRIGQFLAKIPILVFSQSLAVFSFLIRRYEFVSIFRKVSGNFIFLENFFQPLKDFFPETGGIWFWAVLIYYCLFPEFFLLPKQASGSFS